MCGICGKIYLEPDHPVEREIVLAMRQCLNHRGPDEDGLHLKGNCGLGHKRLSIIDLSTGQQPVYNEDGSCCIVFNGEIYNFRKLREGLQARGHRFKTSSDTEVILHLYEEKKDRCVEDLRGMFAFAIWNEKTQELFLARDRVGKKPLFYALTPDAILFASELKALLCEPALKRDLNLEAIDDYLAFQYVPAPESIFKDIQKLPPAHTLAWHRGQVAIQRYWTLDYQPKLKISEEESCERIRMELDEAVRLRLESEVPLGCLLSGGIDSSAVVAFMRRHISGPLRTFSIGFEESTHNELIYARQIAQQFQTQHEEFVVRPNAIETLPSLVWHCDEPFSDSSALPTYYVAQITRRQVKVALNGDGGDESFAGYTRYRGIRLLQRYTAMPRILRNGWIKPMASLLTHCFPQNASFEKAQYLNAFSLMPPDLAYAQYLLIFRGYQRPLLYADRLRGLLAQRDPVQQLCDFYRRQDLQCPIDRKLYTDLASYLPGDLLVKMDRMTMAQSLEGRSPFLDHHLMELAASLPGPLKLSNGSLKYILKKALEPILPHNILHRPKQGFSVPIGAWFKNELQDLTREILLSSKARQRGFFNSRFIEKMIMEHVSGRQNHHHRLWSLLCLEIWCRTFLDRPDPATGPIRI